MRLGRLKFAIESKRWIVARSVAQLGRFRRLSKVYEVLSDTSEPWIHIAMLHLML